jgi:AraC-like DNA-binding protein
MASASVNKFPTRRWMRFTKGGIDYEIVPTDPRASFYIADGRIKYFPYFWHYHPELELALIIQGRGTRIVGDSLEHFEEGDLCFLGPNLPHCWVSDQARRSPVRSAVIQFLPGFLGEKFLTLPEIGLLQNLFTRAKRGLCVRDKTRSLVTPKVIEMLRRPIGHWRHIHDLIWILGTLAESRECTPLALGGLEPMTDTSGRRKINQVLELTGVAANELPSQQAVASAVRLSPPAFSRFFKQCMGKTYMAYTIDLRIARACRALVETDQAITEIAYEAGFSTLSNFNRTFRQMKDMAPREYRNLIRSERTFPK